MSKENNSEVLRKFQLLCDNSEEFAIAAGFVLISLCIENGIDEVIKRNRWYAQICDCIIRDETNKITASEKEEFISMHLKLMRALKAK